MSENRIIEAMEAAFNAAERNEDAHPLQAALRAGLEAAGYKDMLMSAADVLGDLRDAAYPTTGEADSAALSDKGER